MEEDIRYWVELADYDWATAKAMLESGRYVYVIFMCQQTIEKLLKALIVKATKSLPPRLHNLPRLLELAKMKTSEENIKYLEKLSYYYLGSRYPEETKKAAKEIGKSLAEQYYNKSEEIIKWLKENLT